MNNEEKIKRSGDFVIESLHEFIKADNQIDLDFYSIDIKERISYIYRLKSEKIEREER